ncbi:MAG: hypothetical protein ABH864_06150 [archaeon]
MEDNLEEFFDYETLKFWIAVAVVVAIHLVPFPTGEEGIAMILFKTMWQETRSIYFLMGMLVVEFVIIIVPFVSVQRFLSEKMNFD